MTDKELLLVTPEDHDDHDHAPDDFTHLGLGVDAGMMTRSVMDRRRVLSLGALGVGALLGAATLGRGALAGGGGPPLPPAGGPPPGGIGGGPGGGQGDADTVTSVNGECTTLPTETQGPYPADGSQASGQTVNILENSGIVRRDLTRSIDGGAAVDGVPLTLTMTLVNVATNCAPLSGYVIYVWHCTPDGEYSLYSQAIVDEDFLRGAQVTDGSGQVTFQTVFPGCYAGRWPHIHFEIYPNLATAAQGNVNQNVALVSQIAMPEDVSRAVYADGRYSGSVANLNRITLASDNVFSDGVQAQMPRVSGSLSTGYTASITVGIQP
ncbi:dioxygenase family protein [Deinococcus radiophilus]|uniref:Intradiol ring-cleavage dioxygenase n=1 Tax=Deinococcus radiophilus TaxID=32062 RepID=A0A431W0G9_9DEIO|nr:intradiol ring-cleavage dioxygenase [Deinococcus radiophilus]RTR29010.1 intradiol ring-cleavage dioxygenase [Deinococcus radiophilus]